MIHSKSPRQRSQRGTLVLGTSVGASPASLDHGVTLEGTSSCAAPIRRCHRVG